MIFYFLPSHINMFHHLGEYLEHFPSIFKQMVSTSVGFDVLFFQRIHGTYLWCTYMVFHKHEPLIPFTHLRIFIGIRISWVIPITHHVLKKSNVLMVPRWKGNVFHRLGCEFWVILLQIVPSYINPTTIFHHSFGRIFCGTLVPNVFFPQQIQVNEWKFDFVSM